MEDGPLVFHVILAPEHAMELQKAWKSGYVKPKALGLPLLAFKDTIEAALQAARLWAEAQKTHCFHVQWRPTRRELVELFLSGAVVRTWRRRQPGLDFVWPAHVVPDRLMLAAMPRM